MNGKEAIRSIKYEAWNEGAKAGADWVEGGSRLSDMPENPYLFADTEDAS